MAAGAGGDMADVVRRIDGALENLAAELGLAGLSLDEEDQCLIAIDDKALLIQYFDDPELAVLHIDLGPIPETGMAEALRTLMIANTSWRETGGGALGLAPESGHAVLMARLDLEEVDAERFVDKVGDLVEAAQQWARRLRGMSVTQSGAVAGDSHHLNQPIRA